MRFTQLIPLAGLLAFAQAQETVVTTVVVSEYTTYCPSPTTWAYKNTTYTVTEPTTITITNCPCTVIHSQPPPVTTTSYCPPTNGTVPFPTYANSTTVIVSTPPPTTILPGTTEITSAPTKTPVGPTTTATLVTVNAADRVTNGAGALGLFAGLAALLL